MGELHLILGPMFSGKTTKLIELSRDFKNPLVINYALDKRYHESLLSTHDGITRECIQVLELKDVFIDEIKSADAIFINEGQFFSDLLEKVTDFVEKYNKIVYVCGLDGDYRRMPFGDMLTLIPLCDTVQKLIGVCTRCSKKRAQFTQRVSSHTEQVVIGVNEYIPLCRVCFLHVNIHTNEHLRR